MTAMPDRGNGAGRLSHASVGNERDSPPVVGHVSGLSRDARALTRTRGRQSLNRMRHNVAPNRRSQPASLCKTTCLVAADRQCCGLVYNTSMHGGCPMRISYESDPCLAVAQRKRTDHEHPAAIFGVGANGCENPAEKLHFMASILVVGRAGLAITRTRLGPVS